MGPKRAAEAVEAARNDRMTSRAAKKTFSIFIGLLQKRVSGSASKADGVGPGTVLRRFMMNNERLGRFTQRASLESFGLPFLEVQSHSVRWMSLEL